MCSKWKVILSHKNTVLCVVVVPAAITESRRIFTLLPQQNPKVCLQLFAPFRERQQQQQQLCEITLTKTHSDIRQREAGQDEAGSGRNVCCEPLRQEARLPLHTPFLNHPTHPFPFKNTRKDERTHTGTTNDWHRDSASSRLTAEILLKKNPKPVTWCWESSVDRYAAHREIKTSVH